MIQAAGRRVSTRVAINTNCANEPTVVRKLSSRLYVNPVFSLRASYEIAVNFFFTWINYCNIIRRKMLCSQFVGPSAKIVSFAIVSTILLTSSATFAFLFPDLKGIRTGECEELTYYDWWFYILLDFLLKLLLVKRVRLELCPGRELPGKAVGVRECVCLWVCLCVCLWVCLCICLCACICVCLWICLCVCLCVCLWVCRDKTTTGQASWGRLHAWSIRPFNFRPFNWRARDKPYKDNAKISIQMLKIWKNARIDGWTDRFTDECTRIDRRMHGWMDECMDGWMNARGWMKPRGWMNARMDGWLSGCKF